MLRRFLTDIALFALTALGLFVGITAVLCHVHYHGKPLVYAANDVLYGKGGNTWQRFHEYEARKAEHFDVVIVGTSHAYRGYDPAIFRRRGISAFNLGSSAQSPLNTLEVVKHVLNARNTGLLIMDLYDRAFEEDSLESTADLIMNLPEEAPVWAMAAASKDPRTLNMLAVRYLLAGSPLMFTDSSYATDGYCANSDSVHQPLRYYPAAVWKPLPAMQEALVRTLNYCRAIGLPVVLVAHPAPTASDRRKHDAFANWVHSVADPLHIPFLDYAYDHGLPLNDRDHFFDRNHLNAAGVAIFNEALIARLADGGGLKPAGINVRP